MKVTIIVRVLIAVCMLSLPAMSTPLSWTYDHKHTSLDTAALAGEYLLPTTLSPQEYEMIIIPYLTVPENKALFTFVGNVRIKFRVEISTPLIRIHAYNLTIVEKSIVVKRVDEETPRDVTGWALSPDDKQFLDITLARPLEAGAEFTLDISFSGTLKDDLYGFYRSSYTDDSGNLKWLGATFFQTTGARRAFPCFDEPKWKANFTLHIAHAPGFSVVSNMPTDGEDTPMENVPELAGWTWTHFQQSVKMSTYLVAFAVSQFDHIEHPQDSRYRVFARPGAEQQGLYGNEVAPQIISYMEQYTGHAYSLPKMDQIALPDFVAGAMENWGLVTYRETALLYEEGVSTATNKQRVGTVVAHEMAHQWFGNLVSPKWWDSMWLNEGFASYYEYYALAHVEKDWQLDQQFVQLEMHPILQADGLETTRPIVHPVENPNNSSSPGVDVGPSKGGALVRFMISLMGEQNFKLGINHYCSDRGFESADSDDLWRALEGFVPSGLLPPGTSFADVMSPWVDQPGFPVIKLTRDYDKGVAKVTQERFVMLGTPGTPHDELWHVPLTLTSANDPDFTDFEVETWLSGSELELPLTATAGEWVLLNLQQVGFYRVNYDSRNWQLIYNALNNHATMTTVHVINRGQLMDDALALARADQLDYTTALDTTAYLSHETEYHPWFVALAALSYLNDRLNYQDTTRELFEWYVRDKLGAVYSSVGGLGYSEDDEHIVRLKRILVLGWACQLAHAQCNNDANKLFAEWKAMEDPDTQNPIAADVKSVVYCAGMRGGGPADFDFLMARYEAATNVATEQALILAALACAAQPALLNRLLSASITAGSGIRGQDAKSVFTSVYGNRVGVDVALDFLIANFSEAATPYGGLGSIGGLFSGLATKLNTDEHHVKLSQFRAEHESELGAALPGVDAGLATLGQTLGWHAAHGAEVTAYLSAKRGSGAAAVASCPPLLLTTLAIAATLTRG